MSGHVFRSFFRMVSLVLLLVVVGLLSAITTMHFAIHGAEVEVPTLKGMTVAQARSVAAGLGLNLDVDNRYYSADVAAGHILTQSPAPGTVVRSEWRVRVSESLGPQKVDVPNVVGTDERVAALRLRRVGLEVGATSRLPDSSADEGAVLAQDPPAHAQGIEQPSVNLLVAAQDDQSPGGYVMPDFVDRPLAGAKAALAALGIHTGPPGFVDVPVAPVGSGFAPLRPLVRPGDVLAQTPAPGAHIDQTTIVHFTVVR